MAVEGGDRRSRLGGAAVLAQGLHRVRVPARGSAHDRRSARLDRGRPRQPEARRVVRSRQGPHRPGDRPQGPRGPLAEHDHALLPPDLSRSHGRPARAGPDDPLFRVPGRAPGIEVPRRLLAVHARGRPALFHPLAVQPHRRGPAARSRPQDSPPHRPLGHRRHQLAQREHPAGGSRTRHVLAALEGGGGSGRHGACLDQGPRDVRQGPRRDVRRRRERPPRLRRPPSGGGDLRGGRRHRGALECACGRHG